jgi:hypothetical protein
MLSALRQTHELCQPVLVVGDHLVCTTPIVEEIIEQVARTLGTIMMRCTAFQNLSDGNQGRRAPVFSMIGRKLAKQISYMSPYRLHIVFDWVRWSNIFV